MNFSDMDECTKRTVIMAVLIGLVWAILLWVLGGWGFFSSLFIGVLAAVIVGAILMMTMCKGSSENTQSGSGSTAGASSASASAAAAPAAAATSAAADSSDADAEATAAAAEAEQATAAQAEADAAAASAAEAEAARAAEAEAARAAEAEASRAAEAEAASAQADADAAAKAQADAAAAAAKAEADAAAAASAAATAAPAAPAAPAGEGDGTRPAALDGPRSGTADDLKRIKGVGPKMEQTCNALGFYHFDQIAAWTADEVQWVDQNLKGFKGRVSRDAWVDQARLLAAGGETEFSKKVDDGNVY